MKGTSDISNEKFDIGFKISEIGIIPEDWETKKLSEISTVVRGGSPRPAGDSRYFNGNYIPWLTVAALTNIPDSITYVTKTFGYLTKEGSRHSRILEKGTLIIANSGATLGVAKILGIKCCANDGIAALMNQNYGCSRFITYYLNTKTKYFREVVATGNGQPNLNTTLIGNLKVPFPHVQEQKEIGTVLSDMDSLISSLDQLIVKKRHIKLAAMQQLLTGKQRLPGFNTDWKLKRFGDVLKIRHGRSQKEIEVINGRYPILASGGEIGQTNHYLYDKPSVLIGRKGTIDSPQYIEIPFWTVDTLFFTEISNCAFPKFIFYKFNMVPWRMYSEASGVPSLNASTIEGIEFSTPNCLEEQIAIAKVLSDMDSEILVIKQQLDKARNLKQGMMQELLTGRIRLT